jgi:hypothetical protein
MIVVKIGFNLGDGEKLAKAQTKGNQEERGGLPASLANLSFCLLIIIVLE